MTGHTRNIFVSSQSKGHCLCASIRSHQSIGSTSSLLFSRKHVLGICIYISSSCPVFNLRPTSALLSRNVGAAATFSMHQNINLSSFRFCNLMTSEDEASPLPYIPSIILPFTLSSQTCASMCPTLSSFKFSNCARVRIT